MDGVYFQMIITNEIVRYYDDKVSKYNSKYGLGYYTHLHTGIYEKKLFPIVYKDDFNLKDLGEEKLKQYLILGQEFLVNKISTLIAPFNPKIVMDVGAGHGGTSIYLAQNYGFKIKALTLSPKQGEEIKKNVFKANLQKKIAVIVSDISDFQCKNSTVDCIIGMESFCHIINREKIFKKISLFLNKNGILIISDYFHKDKNDIIKTRLNNYWKCNIDTLYRTKQCLINSGFKILKTYDITKSQMPFWQLSRAYSSIKIKQDHLTKDHTILNDSFSFHSDLVRAFNNKILSYNILLLKKE